MTTRPGRGRWSRVPIRAGCVRQGLWRTAPVAVFRVQSADWLEPRSSAKINLAGSPQDGVNRLWAVTPASPFRRVFSPGGPAFMVSWLSDPRSIPPAATRRSKRGQAPRGLGARIPRESGDRHLADSEPGSRAKAGTGTSRTRSQSPLSPRLIRRPPERAQARGPRLARALAAAPSRSRASRAAHGWPARRPRRASGCGWPAPASAV